MSLEYTQDLFDLNDVLEIEPGPDPAEEAYLQGYADGAKAAKALVSRATVACEKGGELRLSDMQALEDALALLSQ